MLVYYILDEGLPVEMNTGWSTDGMKYDKVANMQSAIKFLVKNKDTMAAKVQDIEIYPLGVTKAMYDKGGPSLPKPLKPTDHLPEGSSKTNAIFVHVPREKQQLTPEERRLFASPKGSGKPKVQMARPEMEKLIISPKTKAKPKVKPKVRKMFEVTVKCLHNDVTFQKMIDPKHTIAQLKESFVEQSGVPAANQNLYLKGDLLADDSKAAKEVGIQHGSTLYLEPKSITVQVRTPDGKHIPVTLKQTDTIQFLKESVAEPSGIQVDRQHLKYHGNLLDNDRTARQSNLEDGCIIDLLPNDLEIIVRAPGDKMIPVRVKPDDLIALIKEKVAPESGIEVDQQILTFQGTTLPDKKTCDAMGLKDGCVVDLSTPPPPEEKKEKKKKKEKKEKDDDSGECKMISVLYHVSFGWLLWRPKYSTHVSDTTIPCCIPCFIFLFISFRLAVPPHEPKQHNIPFEPTPFDLTRFTAWFMVGDQVPFEMICPIAMTIAEFKVEILKLRNDARFVERYLRGLEDPLELKVFPAGSWGAGDPLPDDIPVPKDSSCYAFFSVMR